MKKNIKIIIFLNTIYLIIATLFLIAKNDIVLNIETIYQNVFVFSVFLFFAQMLIFESHNHREFINNLNLFKFYIKRILYSNMLFSFLITIISVLLFIIFKMNIIMNNIIYMLIQLFLILTNISFFMLLCNFDNCHYVKKIKTIIIAYFIYIFETTYCSNFFYLNFYYCYLQETTVVKIVIHYFFWLSIPIIICYFKYLRKEKSRVC